MANKRVPAHERDSVTGDTAGSGTETGGTVVHVSWESAEGPRSTQGELLNLNEGGYVILRTAGAHTLWVPQLRIYSISTRLNEIAETAMLVEATAVEAAAVIEAAAEETVKD